MVGAEGKSMLGEAAEKLGFKAREERGVGVQTAAPVDAGAAAAKEDVPAVTALRNRAGESRSPYVSLCCRAEVEVEDGDAAD